MQIKKMSIEVNKLDFALEKSSLEKKLKILVSWTNRWGELVMTGLLLSIVFLYALRQLLVRLRKLDKAPSEIKAEFQSVLDDARDRLPSTGLFAFFKGSSYGSKITNELEIGSNQMVAPFLQEEMKTTTTRLNALKNQVEAKRTGPSKKKNKSNAPHPPL